MFIKPCVLIVLLYLQQQVNCENTLNCKDFRTHRNYPLLPQGSECRTVEPSLRIQGGRDVRLGEYPWIVVLFMRIESINMMSKWCSGSIISSRYVITAAHCLPPDILQVYELVVRVGENNLLTEQDCDDEDCSPLAVDHTVKRALQHPLYNAVLNHNDIGLVQLKKEIHWNDYVYPICLPFSCSLMKSDFKEKSLVVAGFGTLLDVPEKVDTNVLQKVALTGVDESVCSKMYNREQLTSQLCVGGSGAGALNKDACHGDSGGPLVYQSAEGGPPARYFLVGVVSAGENCTMDRIRQAPGIYSRVASYLDWILDNIGE